MSTDSTGTPAECPDCEGPVEHYHSERLGDVIVCPACELVYLTREQMDALSEGEYITPQEVIAAYGLGHGTVYTAIRRGWIPSRRIGGRIVLLRRDVVDRWGPFPET